MHRNWRETHGMGMPDDGHNRDQRLTAHVLDSKGCLLTYSDENCSRRKTCTEVTFVRERRGDDATCSIRDYANARITRMSLV
jgi:hypothetical protein